MKKWVELENECFGPDKKGRSWQMFLLIKRCCSYISHKKTGNVEVVRRQGDVIALTGKRKKDVVQQLADFITRKDVVFLGELK
jgi:hypothetical protein